MSPASSNRSDRLCPIEDSRPLRWKSLPGLVNSKPGWLNRFEDGSIGSGVLNPDLLGCQRPTPGRLQPCLQLTGLIPLARVTYLRSYYSGHWVSPSKVDQFPVPLSELRKRRNSSEPAGASRVLGAAFISGAAIHLTHGESEKMIGISFQA